MTVAQGLYKLDKVICLWLLPDGNSPNTKSKPDEGMFKLPFLKYIPNALTILRFVLIVPFLLFLYEKEYAQAFYLFLVAGLTDGFDGWLARHFQWQSPLGSFIDPMADKLLVASSFISLALIGSLPWWLVILVFLRDLTISVGVLAWYWLIPHQINFEPTRLSKINTGLQLALVTLCLFELAFFTFAPYLIEILVFLTAITTAASYLDYVWTWGKKAYSRNALDK
ncbi:CDP-diacylglycerol--glycerol-3-phosphate 3-phosphatidyltransferase [Legionella jamestowniensis DSM 19215]|uniref:CDP-diacylglycerol--glycerol-3-phosphate 3-phosphatidyltransferase n=2 Tax=Legionella jamestowniensis TaxID=455 RepID=A0A0W0UIU8_9GAMM|nr:phosphatidylglycerophosphate synthase [Legionella jamestowniensis]SFM00901.1 CDP-diacylglycerol--glycerol-3-phosphate 3-phosphatidyltransferase [Legionella jamestowniensis DSM 19215]